MEQVYMISKNQEFIDAILSYIDQSHYKISLSEPAELLADIYRLRPSVLIVDMDDVDDDGIQEHVPSMSWILDIQYPISNL